MDLPQNLTLACSSRCSQFDVDARVVRVLTLREDEVRTDTRADTNGWMMADLFSDEFPASILANAFVGFTEQWIEILPSRSVVIRRVGRNDERGNVDEPKVDILGLRCSIEQIGVFHFFAQLLKET